jgi:hypothetical protein
MAICSQANAGPVAEHAWRAALRYRHRSEWPRPSPGSKERGTVRGLTKRKEMNWRSVGRLTAPCPPLTSDEDAPVAQPDRATVS